MPPTPESLAKFSKIDDVLISPDGEHIAFTYRVENNEVRLAIAKSDLSEVKFVLGYGEDNHLGRHFWASNERIVAWQWQNFGALDGRWQRQQLIGFDIDGRNRETLFVPGRSNIRIYSRLDDDPERILVGKMHYADEGAVSLYHLDVDDGELDYIGGVAGADAESEVIDVAVDTADLVRVSIVRDRGKDKYDPDDDTITFHYRDDAGAWHELDIPHRRDRARYSRLGFSRDNRYFYFASNHDMPSGPGAKRDTLGVFRFDFETESIEMVFRHPDVDVQEGLFGPDGELLGVRYQPGYPDKHYFDESDPRVQALTALSATFPGQEVLVNNYTDDGETAVVYVYSDRNPGQFYLFSDGRLKLAAESRPDLDTSKLGHTEAITLTARDGMKLYGFLTLPPGGNDQDLPLVLHPHGGPHGPYDRWGYDPQVQAMATHGYAVLQVNFRGSGGYGQDFEEAGYGKWGREMQDDITDATLWAVQQGIADRNRICITGGSYGGYATLQALVREPDLYRCGIGVVGVYSLPMMWKKGDMREQGRRRFSDVFLKQYIGDDEAELKQNSPAYNVDRIKASIFLIHGSKDVRVPIEQAEFLRAQLDAAGKPYQWMVRKEGHGFTKVENRADQFTAMLEFLDTHIGEQAVARN
ncbi:MAG: S9 family peptidase [Xanthomonadales bacterium]|nr:S9 family peptidase [Xanthomonadales bacterium]